VILRAALVTSSGMAEWAGSGRGKWGPMPADEKAPKTGRVSPAAERAGGRSELAGLRATCRRRAHVIDALDRVVVHDRYRRTRDAPTSIVGLRA
jgi:hypothetical protein